MVPDPTTVVRMRTAYGRLNDQSSTIQVISEAIAREGCFRMALSVDVVKTGPLPVHHPQLIEPTNFQPN